MCRLRQVKLTSGHPSSMHHVLSAVVLCRLAGKPQHLLLEALQAVLRCLLCVHVYTHTHPAGQHYALCFPAISISILSKNTLVHFELGIEPTPLQLSN